MRRFRFGILLAIFFFPAAVSTAQQNVPAPGGPPAVAGRSKDPARILQEEISADSIAIARGTTPGAAGVIGEASFGDSSTQRLLVEAQNAYYRKKIADYAYTEGVYSWQMLSSQVIFVFVIGLVAAGLWFSWLQFRMDMRLRDHPRPAAARTTVAIDSTTVAPEPGEPPNVTNVKVGPQGFEVTSSVLGVIILTLSLAFLYLYLVYVYPISEVK